jgi:GDPmannose 4,6-dehydratase
MDDRAMRQKTALIIGITGQDGSYLAEFLLQKGYRVIGILRKASAMLPPNIRHLQSRIDLVHGDLLDSLSLVEVMSTWQPDEVYNLASQSYPGASWQLALHTVQTNGVGAHRLFDAVKHVKPDCRVYQASSSEMFGKVTEVPQNENTPFNPVNPYAASKLYAHNIANIYRESFGLFIACGILFNHESPRRGMHFITQKVTYGAACIKGHMQNSPVLSETGEPIVKDGKLRLGNLDAQRDWGFAGDYVEAMWLMLQQPQAEDFIIGTGKTRNIRLLCEEAFSYVGLDWRQYVVADERLTRPTETGQTVADASKAARVLGWKSTTSFSDLIAMMVESHLAKLS